MPAKDVEISLNFIAYCLWREYKFANFLLLNGEGNNGKGTFIKLIQAFLGRDNYSAESLNRLLGNRFATSSLFTKLANFDADLKVNAFIKNGTDIIKVLTGNDEIMGEAKFMNDFKFTNYAKIIMACNKIPLTTDRTIAFGKRMIIINFLKIFYGNDDNVDFIETLKTKEELSGLLNECLRRLPYMLQNGIRKLTKAVEKETWDKYDASVNPVEYFAREALEKTENDEDRITMIEMYEYFNEFANKKDLTATSEDMLIKNLHDIEFDTKRKQNDNERKFYWYGVRKYDAWRKEKDKDF